MASELKDWTRYKTAPPMSPPLLGRKAYLEGFYDGLRDYPLDTIGGSVRWHRSYDRGRNDGIAMRVWIETEWSRLIDGI